MADLNTSPIIIMTTQGATCSASLILRDPSELPEYDGEILVALWGANEFEIVNVRENVGGPFTAEYKGSGDPADPEEWQWWADLRNLSLPNAATHAPGANEKPLK